MAGRTPAEAFRPFRKSIQEAIACFAHTRVTGNTQEPEEVGILTVNRGEPLSLDATDRQIEITCSISYRILPTGSQGSDSWRVSTVGYVHTLRLDGDLAVEFHWHPDDGSKVWFPHIHPRLAGSGRNLGGMHIPSGRVLVEDVLIFAHERGAIPLNDEWEDTVLRIKKRVAQEATWGAPTSHIYRTQPEN